VVIHNFARLNASVVAAMAKARAIIRYALASITSIWKQRAATAFPVCNVPDYCIMKWRTKRLRYPGLTRHVVAHTNSAPKR